MLTTDPDEIEELTDRELVEELNEGWERLKGGDTTVVFPLRSLMYKAGVRIGELKAEYRVYARIEGRLTRSERARKDEIYSTIAALEAAESGEGGQNV